MRAAFGFGFGLPLGDSGDGPIIDWNFAGGALPSALTFSRASTATYYNAAGTLVTASSGSPRMTYDPVTHSALGLLVEEQRTNLLTYSEQLDNAGLTKTNATVTADATAAPDGLVTADKMVDSAATGLHALSAIVTITAGASYTMSMYIKPAEYSRGRLYFGAGANGFTADFDLSGGGSVSGGTALGTGTYTAATITAVANGFYRVAVSGIVDASSTSGTLYCYMHNGASVSYTGVVGNGMYFWGLQLEAGAFPTSYIPTGAASATRAADTVTCTGAAFSQWFNSADGTLLVEFTQSQNSAARYILAGDNASTRIAYGNASDPALYAYDGTHVLSYGNSVVGVNKLAFAYSAGQMAGSINGGATVTAVANGNFAAMTALKVGADAAGAVFLNGPIKRVRYWRKRLTNAQLQALTA